MAKNPVTGQLSAKVSIVEAKKKQRKVMVGIPDTATANRRGATARGVISYQDILDQPTGKYFLILEPNIAQSHLFSVDEVTQTEDRITAKLGQDTVAVFSPLTPWYVINRKFVEVMNTEEMATRNCEDEAAMKALREKLYPKNKAGDGSGVYL